jgi:hypothetical protein
MEALRSELRTTFEAPTDRPDKAVFMMKVLGPLPLISSIPAHPARCLPTRVMKRQTN